MIKEERTDLVTWVDLDVVEEERIDLGGPKRGKGGKRQT